LSDVKAVAKKFGDVPVSSSAEAFGDRSPCRSRGVSELIPQIEILFEERLGSDAEHFLLKRPGEFPADQL
jgi:hypothetical protein